MEVRAYPESPRRFEFEAYERSYRCPRCGGRSQVFQLCRFCHYETWGRWQVEHAPVAVSL